MMSRKRSLLPDIYRQKKRTCISPSCQQVNGVIQDGKAESKDSETRKSLLYLRSLFPTEKFEHRLPAIVMKHQLYSLHKDKTMVDKHINEMRLSGEIKVFRSGTEADEYMIVFTEDYRPHVLRVMAEVLVSKQVADKFVQVLTRQCQDVAVDKDLLMKEFKFKDEEITQLVKASVLTVRDIGSWWMAVPNAGIFLKSFTRGRKSVLTMIRKCKYKEILRKDLEQRKWPKIARLGLVYHIHDIIGAEMIECIQTTSGELLRLKE